MTTIAPLPPTRTEADVLADGLVTLYAMNPPVMFKDRESIDRAAKELGLTAEQMHKALVRYEERRIPAPRADRGLRSVPMPEPRAEPKSERNLESVAIERRLCAGRCQRWLTEDELAGYSSCARCREADRVRQEQSRQVRRQEQEQAEEMRRTLVRAVRPGVTIRRAGEGFELVCRVCEQPVAGHEVGHLGCPGRKEEG